MTQTTPSPTPPPTMHDAMQLLKRDILTTLNCMKIGQIQSYDAEKGTATVQILLKRVLASGIIKDYPLLLDCPVVTLQGGGGSIQFPISIGDECLLIFSDRNLDAWFQTGAANPPPDARAHDLSDAVAIVGVNSLTNPLAAAPATTLRLAYGGAVIDFTGGNIAMSSADGAQFNVEGEDVQLVGNDGAELDLSVTANLKGNGGAEVNLGTLVNIKNGTTDLKLILNGLIDVLTAMTIQGPGTTYPVTAATIALLNAYKLQIAGLLQ